MTNTRENIRIQTIVFVLAILLFGIKITAWMLTSSLAILTDALESVVNILAGGVGLYSLMLSAKPRDSNHPYGHGKAEYLSAAVEGIFILLAGIFIIYKAIENFYINHAIKATDVGIFLMAGTAIVNFGAGFYCVRKGRQNESIQLIAAGKHLMTDTWSTLAIIIGLLLIHITGIQFLDSIVALLMAVFILIMGVKVLRPGISGIMDEADTALLESIVKVLNEKRNENWIDLHNVRFIKFGNTLHCDCHLTVPWYFNVREAHFEVERLGAVIAEEFGTKVEMFVHTDPCLDYSCRICSKQHCSVRKHPQETRIIWTVENIALDRKHRPGS